MRHHPTANGGGSKSSTKGITTLVTCKSEQKGGVSRNAPWSWRGKESLSQPPIETELQEVHFWPNVLVLLATPPKFNIASEK